MGTSQNAGQTTERAPGALRILVPINANETSRWGVRFALQKHHEGKAVEVILLNVGEPIEQWEVLRFRTSQEIDQFQTERAQAFFEETTESLLAEHIPCRGFFKQGDIVFSILDTAEEMACDTIVLPAPRKRWLNLCGSDVVEKIQRRQRATPVVTVNREGQPVDSPLPA